MAIELTESDKAVLEALREVVAEKGADYVYPLKECVYFTTDEEGKRVPSCIFGHVAKKLNIFVDEGDEGNSVDNAVLYSDAYGDAFVKLCVSAQEAQDGRDGHDRKPWGTCLALIEEGIK